MKSCLQVVVYGRIFLGLGTMDCYHWSQSATQIQECATRRGAQQVGNSSSVEHALQKVSTKATRLNLERDTRICSLIDECQGFSFLLFLGIMMFKKVESFFMDTV